jgi:hypothetical protein
MIDRTLTLAIFALLISTHAWAQGDAASADSALNASYQALLSHLDPPAQQQLREAQRAWISFRDRECAFRSRAGARPDQPVACVAELTRQRATELDRQRDKLAAGAGSPNDANVPCNRSVDKAVADTLVRQCMQVSPATHPPCNADNACDLIRDEIKRGCAMIDKEDAPAFCAGFRT